MSEDPIEARMRALEGKLIEYQAKLDVVWKALGIAGLVVLAWLGYTSFYSVPTQVTQALRGESVSVMSKNITALHDQAVLDAAAIAKLSAGGTITVGGQCFQVRTLFRCHFAARSDVHLTWVDNQTECTQNGLTLDPDAPIKILAQC